jgi:carbonic anhydrase
VEHFSQEKMIKSSKLLIILLATLAFHLKAQTEEEETWNYFQSGGDWPEICGYGQRQSPINIQTTMVKPCGNSRNMTILFLNQTVNTSLIYQDNTLRESIREQVGFLHAPDMNNVVQKYVLSNIHFHTFSEHHIDGRPSMLEMHMVKKT